MVLMRTTKPTMLNTGALRTVRDNDIMGQSGAIPSDLQKPKSKEQNHSNFSLRASMEAPGDADRDQQEKHIRACIECSAGSKHFAKIKTSPRHSLIPYSRPWRALIDLEESI